MKHSEPKTLQAAILFFASPVNCREYLVERRWPNGAECPRCGSTNVAFYEKYNRWHCREGHDAPQFTLKTGTIFEESPIGLDKWMLVMWQVVNCKNGVSSYEIHRGIGVTQKTAWFMLQRCRKALQDDLTGGSLKGEVEIDETFIGGKARNMHKDKKRRLQKATGRITGKTIVLGMLERGKKVRATVIADRKCESIQGEVLGNVEKGATIYSDEFASTWRMDKKYEHAVINHLEKYVDGQIHTNGMENFWSLLKRGLSGTYVSVEPFHLFRYVDEQVFRYNHRLNAERKDLTDGVRFGTAIRQIVGKRLTYAELTGKGCQTS
jgi:transposase-like protein